MHEDARDAARVTFSLNEIEGLSKRAARGAGYSWGLSEEAGKAVRWLNAHGVAGAEALVALLTMKDDAPNSLNAPAQLDGTWRAACDGVLCPLISGAALNDFADQMTQDHPVRMTNVAYPVLVVPFAAWAALHIGRYVVVSWQDVQMATDGYGLWINDPADQASDAQADALTCAVSSSEKHFLKAPALRGVVTPPAWDSLHRFAHRTYAPATEASRLRGAGAGTSDND
ncbi:MAG: DUF3726 domain-containing protein [Roseobacter sp.]